MHAHKRFTVATNVQVYFCDPRSPWQRGSNENTNGLVRQYFPRGTNFSAHLQAYLNANCPATNQRPRRLGSETPAEYKRCCTDRLNPCNTFGTKQLTSRDQSWLRYKKIAA